MVLLVILNGLDAEVTPVTGVDQLKVPLPVVVKTCPLLPWDVGSVTDPVVNAPVTRAVPETSNL